MKKSAWILVLLGLMSTIQFAAAEEFDHSALRGAFDAADAEDGAMDGYAALLTSRVCARCHDGAVDEIMQTVHYTFRSENANINYPGGGKHGHYDRSSGITGGNTAVNYTFNADRGCGRCHVGKYLPGTVNETDLVTGLPTGNMVMARDGIDCLVCHAADYNGRDRLVQEVSMDGQTRSVWFQDRTWRAVASIGKPRTENCLRCHREAASPDERGTPFEPWNDVHLASRKFGGNACLHCHTVKHHKMVRGNFVSELFSSDYPVGSPQNDLQCQKCHGIEPHDDRRILNEHIAKIACQTCHIPWTSGVTYATWQGDGRMLRYAREDAYSAIDAKPYSPEGKTEQELWSEYKMRPKYLWFNGKASYLAQPYGARNDPGSKIWPFKPLSSGLPMDASGLRMVDVLDDATVQRAMVGMGSMVPGDDLKATATQGIGTLGNRTEDSSLTKEMQEAMYGTPLLFNMDLEILSKTADLGQSINMAMAKTIYTTNLVGRLLGAGEDSSLIGIFNGRYPGDIYQIVRMPNGENMQKEFGPSYPTGSYLTLTHGVRKKSEALSCSDCHSRSGVWDRNLFEVFSGVDSSGKALFREISNRSALGYEE